MNENLQRFVEDLFSSNELNRLPEAYGGGRIFGTPLIGVSRGDDPIFNKFKEVISAEHMTPAEMWTKSGFEDDDPAASLRTVSIVFPYVDRIREESKTATKMPAEIYSIGRNYANAFMTDVIEKTIAFFQDQGHRAAAGVNSPGFQTFSQDKAPQYYSPWSERHMAFAAGLGTFSLHEGLITEVGCNIRVASVTTDAPLEVTPRKSDDPYANCLYYAEGSCRECQDRCPGDAITEDGHDKVKCRKQLRVIGEEMEKQLGSLLKPSTRRFDGKESIGYPLGCAFCQFDVPCMDKNPVGNAL
jgi:epoxyqueuosine reductase QueG